MTAITQPSPDAAPGFDVDEAQAFSARIMGDMSGAMVSIMCVLGDRLGLFEELGAAGPATSAELAARTGMSERYLREWLYCLASAGYLEADSAGERFFLPPEHALTLTAEGSPFCLGGSYQLLAAFCGMITPVAHAFSTGDGVPLESYDTDLYEGMQRLSATWFDNMLVQQWIPAVEGLSAKLQSGVRVADIGCGAGRALLRLAAAFPHSRFVGYDRLRSNIERARTAAQAAGAAESVQFEQGDALRMLSGRYHLITAFDVLHDLPDPVGLLRQVGHVLDPDGVLLLLESNCADRPSDNRGPATTILYATSVLFCVPTSLADGGAGLGTMGLPPAKVHELCTEAGLTSVHQVPVMNPFNALYVVRP
ncbi:MAG: class I SAM-dependent methyltransferase [Pseudonocardiaceae bacterium]